MNDIFNTKHIYTKASNLVKDILWLYQDEVLDAMLFCSTPRVKKEEYYYSLRSKWIASRTKTQAIREVITSISIALEVLWGKEKTYGSDLLGTIMSIDVLRDCENKAWCGFILEIMMHLNLIALSTEPTTYGNDRYVFDVVSKDNLLSHNSDLMERLELDEGVNTPDSEPVKYNKKVLGCLYARKTYEIANRNGEFIDHCEETINMISQVSLKIHPLGEKGLIFDIEAIKELPNDVKGMSLGLYKQKRQKQWDAYGSKVSEKIKEYAKSGSSFFNTLVPDSRGRLYISNDIGNYIGDKQIRGLVVFSKGCHIPLDDPQD